MTGALRLAAGRNSRDFSLHPGVGREEVKSGFSARAEGGLTPSQPGWRDDSVGKGACDLSSSQVPSRVEADARSIPAFD